MIWKRIRRKSLVGLLVSTNETNDSLDYSKVVMDLSRVEQVVSLERVLRRRKRKSR